MFSAPGKSFKISNNYSRPPYGFTLIELLVVIAVIGILTGGAIVSYNNFNQAQTVRRAAKNLKSDIRETQNRAVSGLKHIDCKKDNYPGGSGDYIEDYQLDGHYVIFDTTDSTTRKSFQRQQSCSAASGQVPVLLSIVRPDPDPEKIYFPKTVELVDAKIKFTDVPGCTSVDAATLTINFEPLGGVEFYDGVGIEVTPVDLDCLVAQIDITDGPNTYRVEVNKSGKITESEVP